MAIKSSFCTEGFTSSLQKPRHPLPWTIFSVLFWFDIKCYLGADEMAEWVSVLKAKPSTLTLILGTHVVERLASTSCLLTFIWVSQHECTFSFRQ